MFDGSFAILKRVFKYLPFSAGESTDANLDIQLGGGAATLAALMPQKTLEPSHAVLAFNQLVRSSANMAASVDEFATPAVEIEPVIRGTVFRPLAAQLAYQARMYTPVGRKPRTSTTSALTNRPIVCETVKRASKPNNSKPARAKTKLLSQSASIYTLPKAARKMAHDHGLRLVA
jgi:hypothetical protein